jgi:hypothetical protein
VTVVIPFGRTISGLRLLMNVLSRSSVAPVMANGINAILDDKINQTTANTLAVAYALFYEISKNSTGNVKKPLVRNNLN